MGKHVEQGGEERFGIKLAVKKKKEN